MDEEIRQFRHREEQIQKDAVKWLACNKGYREEVNDISASGKPVDSIGLLDNRIHLIEVKTVLQDNLVKFSGKPGSIEAKISKSLRLGYDNTCIPLRNKIKDIVHNYLPVFVLLAETFEAGAKEKLSILFRERSTSWEFDYAIWQWDRGKVITIESSLTERLKSDPPPTIPILRAPRNRFPDLTLPEILNIADERDAGPLFATAIAEAEQVGMKVKCGRPTITLYRSGKSVVSINPRKANSTEGLNISYDRSALPPGCSIPGKEAPTKSGHMMSNRLLASSDEIAQFFGLFAP